MSLRARFALAVALLLGAALALCGAWIARLETRSLEAEVDQRLAYLLQSSLAEVAHHHPGALARGDGPPLRLHRLPDPDGARSGAALLVRAPDGAPQIRVLTSVDGNPPPAPTGALEQASEGGHTIRGWSHDDADYAVLTRVLGATGEHAQDVVGVASLERGPLEAARRARLWAYGATALLTWLLGVGLAFVAARQVLRPLSVAAEAAERVTKLGQRLPEGDTGDELGRLARVVNAMLDRVQAASERERTFVAAASHELRRPLAALLAELELALRQDRPAAELRASLEQAHVDAKAMGRLVDSLLVRARAQAGQLKPREETVDVVQLIAEAIDRSLRVLSKDPRVTLGEVEPLTLRADDSLLGMVVENLVVNAATHGGREVEVEVRCRRDSNGDALLEVEDNGPGVPAAEQERIFEPFGRGDRVRSVSGTGLGLAIARDAIQAHGGQIGLTSPVADGHGTRFEVRLPSERVSG